MIVSRKMDRDSHDMSPEKRNALSKLMEQELALDKQSSAIQIMLSKLGTYHTETTNVGSSMYTSLHEKDISHNSHNLGAPINSSSRHQKYRDYATLVANFNKQVEATTHYRAPASAHATHLHTNHVEFSDAQSGSSIARKSYKVLDEEDSVVGADVIKASHAQLARIREHRASTLAQRLQQKQEALQIAEQLRLNALHEVRHKAAMEIASQHHAHQHYFKAIKYMYNNVKIRSNYTLAEFKWKVVSMMSVLQKFMRHVHVNASSDAPYLVLRTRAGWRKFHRRLVTVGRARVRCLQNQDMAYHYRIARHCRGFIDELRKLVRRRHMTGTVMQAVCDIRACKRAIAVFRRRLIGHNTRFMIVEEKVIRLERKQQTEALRVWAEFAHFQGRKRAIIAQDRHRQLLRALTSLSNAAHASVHHVNAYEHAKHFHDDNVAHKYLRTWHAHTLNVRTQFDAQCAAERHRHDLSAHQSEWLRSQVRRCLYKWYERAQRQCKTSAPLKQFRSRKTKALISALFRAWRGRVAQIKKKQKQHRVKVASCRLHRAWAWFRREHKRYALSLRRQREATVRPRSRMRTQHMAQGFAVFRAYVLQNKDKRAVVRKEKLQRLVGRVTEFFSKLYLRRHARRKQRAVSRNRLSKLFAKCFETWRVVASRGLHKRTLKARRRHQRRQLGHGLDMLTNFAEHRALRRSTARSVVKLLWKGRRVDALQQWKDRAQFQTHCHEIYKYGKKYHLRESLREGLRAWMQFTLARAEVAKKGVHRVPDSWARRLTFLHHWVDFVADCKEKRGHVREFQVQRESKLQRVALLQLMQPRERKIQSDDLIHNYRETVLVPLLQHRFFRQILVRRDDREEREADPRLRHFSHRACKQALAVWRSYRRERRYRARSSRLGDRQRFVITTLRALSHWRFVTHMHGALVESERRAAREYRRRYFAPAFKAWLRNTATLTHQFDARYLRHGNVFKKKQFKRFLAAFTRNWQRRKLLQATNRVGRTAYYRKMCGAQWIHFREYVYERRRCKHLKAAATKLRARTLLRIAFGGFVTEFKDTEGRGLGKAHRHFARRTLRAALKTFKVRVSRWIFVKRAMVCRKQRLLLQAKEFLRDTLQSRRIRKERTRLMKAFYKSTLCRRYLRQWQNKDARWNGTQVGSVVSGRPRLASFASPGKSTGTKTFTRQGSFSGKSPGPAKTTVVVKKRRLLANPIQAMQLRRCNLAFQALIQFTALSKEDKAVLKAATHAVSLHREHVHMALWKQWMREVTFAKTVAVRSTIHMGWYRCAQVIPVLVNNVRLGRHLHDAEHHHTHFQYVFAWKRWTKYAYTGLRRARSRARALQKQRERELQAAAAATPSGRGKTYTPQFIDDDFSERMSTRGRGGSMDDCATVDTTRDLSAAVAAIEVLDHRVSVQRTQWHKGEVMHLVHSCLHAIARWRRWYRLQYHHEHLMQMCDHRQQEKVFTQLRGNLVRRKQYRADVRCALKARHHYFLKNSFHHLALNRRLSMAVRQLRISHTSKIFSAWKMKVQYRGHAKLLLTHLEGIHRTHMLQVAFREWVTDTAVENAVVMGVSNDRQHKLHHGIDHLVFYRKLRRRQSALLLRARQYKTNSLLRKVYTNMLLEMEARYRSIEVMRDCARFHSHYHCRHVIYNLFYLRRNRIAKNYNTARKFRLLIAALRVNKAVVRYHKLQMRRANVVIVRKMLLSLHRHARASVARKRKLRALKDGNGNKVARAVMLVAWNRANRLLQGLRQWRQRVKHRRLRRKLFKACIYSHMKHHVYRCFRMLLSNARKRNLKERNSKDLYKLFLNLQLRRAVSRLDINVSHKWALGQKKRLLDVHYNKQTLGRGLAAMKWSVSVCNSNTDNLLGCEEEKGNVE